MNTVIHCRAFFVLTEVMGVTKTLMMGRTRPLSMFAQMFGVANLVAADFNEWFLKLCSD